MSTPPVTAVVPGQVVGLYRAEAGGAPMEQLTTAELVAGQGIVGDRYATGRGEWSFDPRLCNEVTLVAVEDLRAAEAEGGASLQGGRSRRNIETRGVDLTALVGHELQVGEVRLHADRPCDPCRYLDGVTGVPAKAALTGRGGLRATVLRGGTVAIGDAVLAAAPPEG